ncbi:MAG: 4-(cytidine 5'-diphospho)-2-C-methyl-D-erythritol kinase [Bacillota bacterium]|jgi:4-diphosphocytidyl-2-C-methyl-D-erythritol kinase
MIINAPAKINWSLEIVGKRPDGYHLLQMIMQQISLMDIVKLEESEVDSITSNAGLPTNEDNIALKAWLLLKKELGLNQHLSIKIEKNIPIAAGLAGGSTDAAAVLKGANQLFDLGMSHHQLRELALKLGSDIPFCLLKGAALAEGIGEVLTPLPPLPRQHLLLINPGFSVSTAEIYKEFSPKKVKKRPHTQALIEALLFGEPQYIGPLLINFLETVTIEKYPQIAKIKFEMAACGLYPLMSGSGPTVFGLAPDEETALAVQKKLLKIWPFVKVCHTL